MLFQIALGIVGAFFGAISCEFITRLWKQGERKLALAVSIGLCVIVWLVASYAFPVEK